MQDISWAYVGEAYLAAAVVAYGAYRYAALTRSGGLAGLIVGGTILGFGGLLWAILLTFFFASSSLLSFAKRKDARKRQAAEMFEKGGRRDATQVIANGGVAAVAALLSRFIDPGLEYACFGAFAGALAASTADTWATELGVLSKASPRLITTGKQVIRGTSGAVTWLGSSASLVGAFSIATVAAAGLLAGLPAPHRSIFTLFAATLLGGVMGSLADSLLGATVQAAYWCPFCEKPTESQFHTCGTPTQLRHGVPGINNDLVNLLATLVGAVVGGAVSLVM